MNLALAPRIGSCGLCARVPAIEDVTVRLFDDEGNRKPPKGAVDYLRSIGYPGRPDSLRRSVTRHGDHVAEWIAKGAVTVLPAEGEVRAIEVTSGSKWLDVNQAGLDVGMDAFRSLRVRQAAGELTPKEELQLAKLGLNAAGQRVAALRKGAESDPFDALTKIAAGLGKERDADG